MNNQRRPKRTFRKATAAERKKYGALRRKLQGEKADIVARGRRIKRRHDQILASLAGMLGTLRSARRSAGLSLADMQQRCGMTRAALSRLENGREANPTLATLERYAAALGKRVVLVLEDEPLPEESAAR